MVVHDRSAGMVAAYIDIEAEVSAMALLERNGKTMERRVQADLRTARYKAHWWVVVAD